MREYLLAVVGITLLSAVLLNTLPQGKTNKTLKGALRAACLLVVIAPILTLFQKGITLKWEGNFFEIFLSKSIIQTDGEYIEYCREKTVIDAESNLQERIKDKFGADVGVKIESRIEQAPSNLGGKGEMLIVEKVLLSEKSTVEKVIKEEISAYILKEYAAKTEWIC